MIDLNDIKSMSDISTLDLQNDKNALFDKDELIVIDEQIKDQYINFNNLGRDLLSDIDNIYLPDILANMLLFSEDNYLNIVNLDDSLISVNKKIQIGQLVYKFLCIDCYNILLPNYFDNINCVNINQFDSYFNNVLKGDSSNFKTGFIKIINTIVEGLMRLQNLDKSISTDKNYNDLLTKFTFYIDLVNFGDTTNFLENYIRPVFSKNSGDILWRIK